MADISKAATMFWASIIARAWEDDHFKKKLLKDPNGTLRELGFLKFVDDKGKEVKIKVEEATTGETCSVVHETNTYTFYLPQRPECAQLCFEGQFTAGTS